MKDVYNKDYAIKSSFALPQPSKEEKVQCQPDMYRPFNEDMTEDMEDMVNFIAKSVTEIREVINEDTIP